MFGAEGWGGGEGAYSLGNRKEGAGGWRGCGKPGMRERVRERERGDEGVRRDAGKERGDR